MIKCGWLQSLPRCPARSMAFSPRYVMPDVPFLIYSCRVDMALMITDSHVYDPFRNRFVLFPSISVSSYLKYEKPTLPRLRGKCYSICTVAWLDCEGWPNILPCGRGGWRGGGEGRRWAPQWKCDRKHNWLRQRAGNNCVVIIWAR